MNYRTLLTSLLLTGLAAALPEGGQIVNGQIQVQGSGNVLQILQSSPQGILNWSSFNISPQEVVRFLQPAQGVTLNRVTGSQASLIEGLLQANGTIFLLNPNGILFTQTAQVNAGSLVASTLSMSDADFLQRNYHLVQAGDFPLAAVVNRGSLEVGEGGYLVLAAPLVHNEGLIVAHSGQIALGAGTEATLSFDAQGLLSFTLPGGWQGGQPQEAQTVLLTRGQLTDSLSQVLATPATPEATSLAAASGILVNSGTISSDGAQAGRVLLNSEHATVHLASGLISANALSASGNGGELQVFSAGTAFSSGQLQARGGDQGRGGKIELSGQTPDLYRAPDLYGGSAAGVFLLDPTSVEIVNTAGSFDSFLPDVRNGNGGNRPQGVGTVSVQALEAVTSGLIRLEATNSVLWTQIPADGALDLQPGVSLSIQSGGTFSAAPGQHIRANGGDVDIQAQGNLQAPAIQVTAGSVDLTSDGGEIKLTGDVVSESIDLSAPLGPIYTGGHLVSATAGGVQVEATNFLTAPGSTSAARVDSTGKLDLTISGADDPGAGAAARIQGTQGSLVVSQTAQSGSVFVNGVLVTDNSVPGGGGGGGSTDDSTTTVDDHGGLLANRGLESEVEVELERSGSNLRGLTLQSSSQQLSSPSTFGVFFADTEHAVSLFPVNNLSLLGSNFIPLYSLQLVSPQVVDNRDGFWQGFIEEFILWTEPEVKEEP